MGNQLRLVACLPPPQGLDLDPGKARDQAHTMWVPGTNVEGLLPVRLGPCPVVVSEMRSAVRSLEVGGDVHRPWEKGRRAGEDHATPALSIKAEQ